MVTGNSAVGSFGGGAHRAWLFGCTLSGNAAAIGGGGACMSMLENCVLTSNAASEGGGAWGGRLSNCSIVANTASSEGGGVWSQSGTWGPSPPPVGCDDWCDDFSNAVIGVVRNCIVYNNTAPTDANHAGFTGFGSTGEGSEFYGGALNHSCTTPLPTNGVGNITNAPLFVDVGGGQPSNFRLQPDSPCINAGRNAYATGDVDRDSNPRIVGGTVDLGAYEYQMPQSTISYAWLQQYGLPTDGSADLADPDGDGHNNSQEWHAWTDPTDSTSVLRLLTPLVTTDGLLVRWQSLNGDNPALSVPGPAPTTAIGQWRPTPPNFAAAFGTQARYLTPWTMRSPAQFRPGPPPSLTSAIYTADYNEIRVLGSRGNANRRPEQAASAELQEKGEDWLADVYRQHPLPLLESARREALVWMAGMDAQIQIFDAKYAYNFWRPITAIRTGALDGNDDTPGDPAWTPFLDTHNHPDYPSALVLSTAAMLEILVLLHGDQFSFSATSTNPDRTRTFAKLSDYVEDAITARVVGGTHFRHTCNVSAETGRQIARYAFQRYLRPVPRLQTGPSQPGEFTLVLQADLPFRYSIERSSDLVQWLPWQTIVPGPIRLNDTNAASAEQRFYRAGVDW